MILGRTGRCRPCQRSRSEFRVIRRIPGRPGSQLYQFYQSSALSDLRHGIISWPIHEVEEARMLRGMRAIYRWHWWGHWRLHAHRCSVCVSRLAWSAERP